VTVLNEFKRGWDNAADNVMHLTMIHTPDVTGNNYQGDKFMHHFRYCNAGSCPERR
jgi:hypothetical protein